MSELAKRLRKWRRVRGLSLRPAAALLGVSTMTLLRAESDLHQRRPALAARIAAGLGEQPPLPLTWRRVETDAAVRAWLKDAASRGIAELPDDLALVQVWRGKDGSLLITPATAG